MDREADGLAEAACQLAETVATHGWTPAAADDALTTVVTLAEALSALGPAAHAYLDPAETETLAAVLAATADLRRQETGQPQPPATPTPAAVPAPAPRRRGLSTQWQRRADPGPANS